MPAGPALDPHVLGRLERYYDLVPRVSARTEEVGPFTLFVSTGAWPYYARPRLGLDRSLVLADVLDVLVRQHELGVPEALEWVTETTPSLDGAARAAGLEVEHLPLMVLVKPPIVVPPPPGVQVRLLRADDPALAAAQVVSQLGFAAPGTAPGPTGGAQRDAALATHDAASDAFLRSLIDAGHLVTAVAESSHEGVLAVGNHAPRGEVTEVLGVATLPAARRHGLGAALTSLLVEDALGHGVETVFLSAGSEEIARVYLKVGFRRAGTACIARAAAGTTTRPGSAPPG